MAAIISCCLFSSTAFSGNIVFTKALRGSSIVSGETASVFTDAYNFTIDNTEAADIAIHVRLYLAEDRFIDRNQNISYSVSYQLQLTDRSGTVSTINDSIRLSYNTAEPFSDEIIKRYP
ncbi:MAG: hypothetical protein LBK03_02635, partial [Bacteroidales bacterium]|nr:hypothetical protein [Bacteroidales bacterium]